MNGKALCLRRRVSRQALRPPQQQKLRWAHRLRLKFRFENPPAVRAIKAIIDGRSNSNYQFIEG
jgi:hypothetical protein